MSLIQPAGVAVDISILENGRNFQRKSLISHEEFN